VAGKFLVVLIVVLVVGALLWSWRRPAVRARARPPARVPAMVACASCGVHVPAGEALERDGRLYCCAGHLESGPRSPA
jgi:uncharacterized protein